jgi:uncharacterized caspase-like protein
MSTMKKNTIVFIILFNIITFTHASETTRTALVIGNSDYQIMPLENPENDAEDLANKLKGLGFDVLFAKNQTKPEMRELIREFKNKLKQNGGVGLFFYAGHGVQIDGKNYLIPVDFSASSAYEVPDESVPADWITGAMEEAGNSLNIVILDACRDNPFPRKTRSGVRGLARMESASGTIIAYSTSPGDVAADGNGRNSPYTENLLKYIDKPGLTIEQVFKRVRVGVENSTGGKQLPWETSSLRGDFYFKPSQTFSTVNVNTAIPTVEKQPQTTAVVPRQSGISKLSTSQKARKLIVFTNPPDSEVKLSNIDIPYRMGLKLEPGDYRLEVSKEGYIPQKQWVNIDQEDISIQINLIPE